MIPPLFSLVQLVSSILVTVIKLNTGKMKQTSYADDNDDNNGLKVIFYHLLIMRRRSNVKNYCLSFFFFLFFVVVVVVDDDATPMERGEERNIGGVQYKTPTEKREEYCTTYTT